MKTALIALFLLVPVTAHAEAGRDFASDAKLFYRVVACGGEDPVDAKWQKVVDSHCVWMKKMYGVFKKKFGDPASTFFTKVRPSGLPTTVVYPFGGGDLVSALVTYPDATEVTTMSLEHAGDPTRLATLSAKQLKKYLANFRTAVGNLLSNSDSESDAMKLVERGPIPGQLAFFLTGAAAMGWEPVHLRFFHLGDDGSVQYYTDDEVAQLAKKKATKKKKSWVDTDWSVVYSHSELELQKVGDASRTLVHRHIAANLDNAHYDKSAVQKHLEAKGKVSMMTKAASYLLWMKSFSSISDYMATHLVWMASDSSGITTSAADAAGLEIETYGTFTASMFNTGKAHGTALAKLFKKQPKRKLGFRYGYRDVDDKAHLLITRPKAP